MHIPKCTYPTTECASRNWIDIKRPRSYTIPIDEYRGRIRRMQYATIKRNKDHS